MKTCPCGHVINSEGYCLVLDDQGEVHRVPKMSAYCVDCGEKVIDTEPNVV